MNPQQRWNRIQDLCEQAEAVPPADRERLLSTVERDEELRTEALQLLDALAGEEQARAELQQSSAQKTPPLPERIGSYRVTGLLGRGGTSTVYAAEREAEGATSKVAVKVLHAFLSDEESTARFHREQRILAGLDHPALCRVLDAGVTPERQPFLVLERVEGRPIDEYADAHTLSVAERVRLVIDAAEALAAVHRNFVAHLDLKPSNLFVSDGGNVRLLDFGTAKLMDPGAKLTTTRQLTPVYASPEQLRGDPVTTASDIYSLGLILYELLAGVLPFTDVSIVSIAHRASGATTTKPMADKVTAEAAQERGLTVDRLRHVLRGDIDRVVAKALAAEPGRRYATVGEFGDDLRRYLENRPVLARRQTVGYRFRKYAARNRGALALTLVLLVGLLSSAGYALWQQRVAIEAGQRAQASASFLSWLINSSNPMYGGRPDMTVLDLVKRAEERLRRGDVLDRDLTISIEPVLGGFMFSAGQQERGIALAQTAFEEAKKSGKPMTLVSAATTLGGMLLSRGDCPGALKVFGEGDAVLAKTSRGVPIAGRISFLVSRDQVKAGCEGDLTGKLTAQAVALLPEISDTNTEFGMPARIWKALVYNASGRALLSQKKYAESRRAVDLGLHLAAQEPDGRNIRVALLQTRAATEYAERDVAAAARSLDEAAELAETSASLFEAIRLKVMAGTRLAEAGQKDRAIALADRAIEQASAHSAEIAETKWMILIDAAFTYFRADRCEKVPALVREVDALTGSKMPPQWKGNRLAVEALCLAQSGKLAEATTVGTAALSAAGATWGASSSLRKKIEEIVGVSGKQ